MGRIRFVDETGAVRLGADPEEGRAAILEGDPWGEVRPTGRTARVARLLAPVVPSNVYCIGLNYRRHAAETGASLPEHPVVFMKPTSAVQDPGGPIRLPACQIRGPEVDYEGELAVVVGRACRDVAPGRALDHVLGYTCANDVSARRWQKQAGGGQWVRGKGFDTFCPLGPRLVLREEIPDPQALAIRTSLSGRVVQDSTTSDMVFPVAELVSFLSRDTTLLPGTVILTGTPEGVGFVRQPPVFLAPGDLVEVAIEGIGTLANPVISA